MSAALELHVRLPYHQARALRTLCERLASERSRQIAAQDLEMHDALDAAQQLHAALDALLEPGAPAQRWRT
jgi:hypothetical protein